MASAQLPGNPIDSKVGLEGRSSLPAGEELPFTQRYGIKPAKKIINEHAGSILADEDPPVVLSSAEEHRLRTAFTNNAPAADPTGGKTLNREGIRAVLKELGIPGISDDMLIARYFSRRSDLPEGDVRMPFEEFLELYKAVAAPSRQYGERLRRACARGEDGIIRDLIARGSNPNLGNGQGQNCLHYAAEYGQVGVMSLLRSLCGESLLVDAKDVWGWTPLHTAVIHGQQQALEMLISLGAKLDTCNKEGRTALHWAASKGKDKAAQTLVSSGGDLNVKDRCGWTALHYACMNGHVPVIKILIQGGADVKALDILDYPPQHSGGVAAGARLKLVLSGRRGSTGRRGSKVVPESYPKDLLGGQFSTITS